MQDHETSGVVGGGAHAINNGLPVGGGGVRGVNQGRQLVQTHLTSQGRSRQHPLKPTGQIRTGNQAVRRVDHANCAA